MWVRVGSFLVKPNQVADLRTTYNEQAIPKVRAYPGNLGCLLLEPSVDGEPFLVVTVWQDRAAADSYESSGAAAEVVSLVRAFFAGPPNLHSYESTSIAGLPSQAPATEALNPNGLRPAG
jgi:quinol monooxygenase YgiN